jgi:hypothetical protein
MIMPRDTVQDLRTKLAKYKRSLETICRSMRPWCDMLIRDAERRLAALTAEHAPPSRVRTDASAPLERIAAMAHRSINCPKCGRALSVHGEVTVRHLTMPMYCCPECVTRRTLMGEFTESPLVFLIGPDGQPFDPVNPDGEIDLRPYE